MNQTHKTKNQKFYLLCLLGVGTAIIVSIITSIITSVILLKGTMNNEAMRYIVSAIQLISVFIGAFIACRKYNQKYILTASLVCVGYFVLLTAAALMLFDCTFDHLGSGVTMCVIGAMLASIMCLIKQPRNNFKKRRL